MWRIGGIQDWGRRHLQPSLGKERLLTAEAPGKLEVVVSISPAVIHPQNQLYVRSYDGARGY